MLLFYHLFFRFLFIQVCSKCLLTDWCFLYNDLYNHSHFVFVPSLRSLLLMNDLWVRLNVLSVAILVVRSATRHISNLINQSGVVGRHTNPSAEGSACFWKHQFAAIIHIRLAEPVSQQEGWVILAKQNFASIPLPTTNAFTLWSRLL